jgi:hypothetical protein
MLSLLLLLLAVVASAARTPLYLQPELVALQVEQANLCSHPELLQLINETIDVIVGTETLGPVRPSWDPTYLARFMLIFNGHLRAQVSLCKAYARTTIACVSLFGTNWAQEEREYVRHCTTRLAATTSTYLQAAAAHVNATMAHDDPYRRCLSVARHAARAIVPLSLM